MPLPIFSGFLQEIERLWLSRHKGWEAPGMAPRVSLCVIARNEEQLLPRCLASATDLVAETVLVDTGSTDRTKQVAAGFGARVFDFPWCDDFSAAMNESLARASGDWIFWLHADHWLDDVNRERLRALFASLPNENAAYLMKWLCPSQSAGEQGLAIDTVHLFRCHPLIRWQGRVHEQIAPAITQSGGAIRFSPVVIMHSGYETDAAAHAKLERNLRLLELDARDQPDDMSVLFHLGWTYHLLGRPGEAIPPLRRSLALCQPGQSILPKNLALLVRSLRQLGRQQEAFNTCLQGLNIYPRDPELLFHEGQLRREGGDLAGAERAILRLLNEPHETAVACGFDLGLKSYKARCALAEIYRDQGRLAEAEREWHAALAEQPTFTPAWLCLGDMWLQSGRPERTLQVAEQLIANPPTEHDGTLLKARCLMVRGDYPQAHHLLDHLIARAPAAPWPRVVRAHALLLEGRNIPALVAALKDVLRLDPTNNFAQQQLPLARQRAGLS